MLEKQTALPSGSASTTQSNSAPTECRPISVDRRLHRALEHRDRSCVVPGCHATRGLHAHHLQYWEDGGPTELDNLVLLCPHHHRSHHHGDLTLTGPALN